jgi:hypothetical protein
MFLLSFEGGEAKCGYVRTAEKEQIYVSGRTQDLDGACVLQFSIDIKNETIEYYNLCFNDRL